MPESKEFTPKGEAEIRQSVIEEFGLSDDDNNKPFIDKAVKKELDRQSEKMDYLNKEKSWEQEKAEHEKKLSKAIEQKVKYRDEAKKLASLEDDPVPEPKPNPTGEPAPDPNKSSADNEKLTALEKEVATLKAANHRARYSHLKDDEYQTVLNVAGGIDKFEETLNSNPIVKNYIETNKVNERVAGATNTPSTRSNPSNTKNFADVDLSNPEDVKWLRADPKRLKEYDDWIENNGGLTQS